MVKRNRVKKITRGLYIGRFQPFHLGHMACIDDILSEVDELIICIGTAQVSFTERNPFTAGERLEMISAVVRENYAQGEGMYVVVLPDTPINGIWAEQVKMYCPHFDVVYSNNPLVKELFHRAGKEVKTVDLTEREILNSTNVRRLIADDDVTWFKLVPEEVRDYILSIKGDKRIQAIMEKESDWYKKQS